MTAATVAQNKAREDRIKVEKEEVDKLMQQQDQVPVSFVAIMRAITKTAGKKVSKKK